MAKGGWIIEGQLYAIALGRVLIVVVTLIARFYSDIRNFGECLFQFVILYYWYILILQEVSKLNSKFNSEYEGDSDYVSMTHVLLIK